MGRGCRWGRRGWGRRGIRSPPRGGDPGDGGSGPVHRPRRRGSGAPPVSPAARSGSGRRAPPFAGRRHHGRAGSSSGAAARAEGRSIRRPPSPDRRPIREAPARQGASPRVGRAPPGDGADPRPSRASCPRSVAAAGRSRERPPSGPRAASRRSTALRRATPASGRPANRARRRARPPRRDRAPVRRPARPRSRRLPVPRRRAAVRGSSRRSSARPGARRSRCAAGRRVRRSRPGRESPSGRPARRRFAAHLREKERARMGRRAARPEGAPWRARRPPAELPHPTASGGTPEPPTRPGRGSPSDGQYRTSVRSRQRFRGRPGWRRRGRRHRVVTASAYGRP